MLAAFFGAVTGLAEVIGAIIAARTVVVKVIFDMILVASLTGDLGFGIQGGERSRRCGGYQRCWS